MVNSSFSSQWTNLLQHLGAWRGSFTRLTPSGELKQDTNTLVTLEGLNDNQTIRQTIQRFPDHSSESPSPTVLEYSQLNRGILFFDNGAFSVGSMQFSPVSEFGAELGFIHGDRRLRLVPLFSKDSQLSELTLIREHRQDTVSSERPPLSVRDLLGEWLGEAVTIYPDWRDGDVYSTSLSVRQEGDRLHQSLKTPQFQLTSTARIDGSILRFEQGETEIQVLLLSDGASLNTPVVIPHRRSFFVEAGWLISDGERLRLIRSYDERGTWISLTLVTECKVSN